MIKPLIISTSNIDGAGKAAYRLYKGLQEINVDPAFFVQSSSGVDASIISSRSKVGKIIATLRPQLNQFSVDLVYPKRDNTMFSIPWFPENTSNRVKKIEHDVINLHWVCQGFLQVETVSKFSAPVVWTLHDMWPFTGGCHYSSGCKEFQKACGHCPQLRSSSENDLSRWIWKRKKSSWAKTNLTIVTPSFWLAKQASESSLFKDFRIEVIPNGLDINVYKPFDRQFARSCFNLPSNKKLILFGSANISDPRKGWNYLSKALTALSNLYKEEEVELVVFGSHPVEDVNIGFKKNYLGRLSDDVSLALLYSACDVFVTSSVEDNLPNTVMEALACGTPCVGFDVGGIPDMIDHGINGYLCKPFDIKELVEGITHMISDTSKSKEFSNNARSKALQNYSLSHQANSYMDLFNQLA